jgi:hypothetical protein
MPARVRSDCFAGLAACSAMIGTTDENDENGFTGSIPTEPPARDAEAQSYLLDSDPRRLSRVSWGDEEIYEFVRSFPP